MAKKDKADKPEKTGRLRQLGAAYRLTKQNDRFIGLILLAVFLVVGGVVFAVGWWLVHWLVGQMDACAVIAPTAVAAINIGGDTIHSFFGLPPEHLDPDDEYRLDQRRRLVIENLKLLIVDEVSMVLPNLVDVIDHTLKSVRRNNRPFGGVPVLFVHDEIVLEVPEADGPKAAEWLKAVMAEGMAPLIAPVPAEVEVTVGPTWGG